MSVFDQSALRGFGTIRHSISSEGGLFQELKNTHNQSVGNPNLRDSIPVFKPKILPGHRKMMSLDFFEKENSGNLLVFESAESQRVNIPSVIEPARPSIKRAKSKSFIT